MTGTKVQEKFCIKHPYNFTTFAGVLCFITVGKDKLKRFKQNAQFANVIEPTRDEVLDGFRLSGRWHEHFGNDNPIVLELGCGSGAYTVNLAKDSPHKNYIGVDIKGARIWRGAKSCNEQGIKNVAFLRTKIELIEHCFSKNEVLEIWITFPDPQIKYRRTKHRLTCERFLRKYHTIIKPEGVIHLKSDSEFTHGYALGLLQGQNHQIILSQHDIYSCQKCMPKEVTGINTHYEKIFLKENKPINYIKFKLNY